MTEKSLFVKQIRSAIGRTPEVKATLVALGLGRIGKSQLHKPSPALIGMIKKVSNLVSVEKRK